MKRIAPVVALILLFVAGSAFGYSTTISYHESKQIRLNSGGGTSCGASISGDYSGTNYGEELELLTPFSSDLSVSNMSGDPAGTYTDNGNWSCNQDYIYFFTFRSINGTHPNYDNRTCVIFFGIDEAPMKRPPIKVKAFPNPFNPETAVQFTLPQAMDLNVTIMNTLGQTVATLGEGHFEAGEHQLNWNASSFSSGTYVVCIKMAQGTEYAIIQLLK